MMKRLLATFLFLICSTLVFGQGKFFDEIHSEVSAKKDARGIKSSEEFKVIWESGQLTDEQKKRFVELIVALKRGSFPILPTYVRNLDIINYAITKKGLTGSAIDSLIIMQKKIIEKVPKGKAMNQTYDNLLRFLKSDTLYSDNKHTYVASGGSFKIHFIDEPVFQEEIMDEEVDEKNNSGGFEDNKIENAWDSWDESSVEDSWGTVDEPDQGGHSELDDATPEINESVLDYAFEETYIPPAKGAVIQFENIDIKILSSSDSAVTIKGTNASLLLDKNQIVGEGGTFDWTSAGLSEEVKVEFKKYTFQINSSKIDAEGVSLTYPDKFDGQVDGIFEYQVENYKNVSDKSFPRFMSYKSNVVIKDLGENIKYHGGFSLKGKTVHSSSLSGGKCKIEVSFQDTLKFRAASRDFEMGDSTIVGYPVAVTIYEHGDSIYHPGVRLDFEQNTQDLKLYKNKSAFKATPFKDSYHQIEILADAVYWNLADTVLRFTNISAKNEVSAYFDSFDNFQLKRYAQLQGLYSFHPLQMATNYAYQKNKFTFYADELAKAYKQDLNQVKSAMLGLMQAGYIDYDPNGGLIIIKEKAKHYLQARRNKTDFDYYSIRSVDPGGANGVLNLKNNDLTVFGVDEFIISDSLNVVLYPTDRKLTIKENRDFIADGMITTNNYRFIGKNFNYSHSAYDIQLVDIDSIEFYVEVRDSITGKVIDKKILDNKLTYSSGTLTLDEPGNKSCKKRDPRYPHFDANKGASIYFTGKEVLNGAYDSSIYYKIPPFDVDSMSGDISSITFDGTFISGGVFPDFEQKMEIQKDLSFGFKRDAPADGYPIYGGKGRFFGSISMDGRGLRGKGRIEMGGTVIESKDFVFYPDSVEAIGERAFSKAVTTGENTSPNMTVDDYEMKWVVSKDSLALSSYTSPIFLYDSLAKLNGTVVLSTSKGMKGLGILETEGSLVISQDITFKKENYVGRNSQFEILSDVEGKPALRSDLVRVEMNISKGVANFNPEKKGFASNEFPYMQYKTSIDNGVWDMNARTVTMKMPEGADISQSYFYSTNKKQDSLVFNAEEAIYYMDSLKMVVSGVPEIRVVDASVIPDKGVLVIGENANIDSLHNAVIIMDTVNKYHRLFDGSIKINSRDNFAGRAKYQFVNFEKDTLAIEFNSFELIEKKISKKQAELHSRAKGSVAPEDTFFLAPNIQYQGEAVMESDKKNLDLDGYVRLNLEGMEESSEWMKYERHDTLDEVRIPISDDENAENHFTGIMYSRGHKKLYPVFVGKQKSDRDMVIFHAENMLTYDFGTEEFEVSTEKRLHNEEYAGNFFAYHQKKKMYRYSGKFDFLDMGDIDVGNIELRFAGFGETKLADSSYKARGVASIYFNVPALDKLGKHVAEGVQLMSLPKKVSKSDSLFIAVANLQDNKTAVAYKKTLEKAYDPLYKQIKKMETAVGFYDLNLVWNAEKKAWYSKGKLGVSNIGKNDISTYIDGIVEIRNLKTGPEVNIYMALTQSIWCFFSYSQSSLLTMSSFDEYNQEVSKNSQAAKNEPRGLYYFATADDSDKNRFVNRFSTDYGVGAMKISTTMPIVKPVEDNIDDEFSDEEQFEVDEVEEQPKPRKKSDSDFLNQVLDDELGGVDGENESENKKKKKDKSEEEEVLQGLEQLSEPTPQPKKEQPVKSVPPTEQEKEDAFLQGLEELSEPVKKEQPKLENKPEEEDVQLKKKLDKETNLETMLEEIKDKAPEKDEPKAISQPPKEISQETKPVETVKKENNPSEEEEFFVEEELEEEPEEEGKKKKKDKKKKGEEDSEEDTSE